MLFIIGFPNERKVGFSSTSKLRFAKDKHPFFQCTLADDAAIEIPNEGEITLKYACQPNEVFKYDTEQTSGWIQCVSPTGSGFYIQLNLAEGKVKKIVVHMDIMKRRIVPKVVDSQHLLTI